MKKTVETIEAGETLLKSAKRVSGGKIQLEFAEIINNPKLGNRAENIVGVLNASDERFNQAPKARRAWVTGTPEDIKKMLGVEIPEGQESVELNILNPEMGGKRLRLQVVETTKGNEYQASHIETSAKRQGADGPYLKHNGQYIFSNTIMVSGEAQHIFLDFEVEGATVSAAPALSSTPAEGIA